MKFTMPQKALADAIKTVLPAVSTKNTIPVLSGIHIEALTSVIRFTASDMAVTVQLSTSGEIERHGSLVIEAKRLAALIGKVTGEVTIEADPKNGHALIRWGKSKAELMAWPGTDYISVPVLDPQLTLTLRSDRLAKLLNQTRFAASHDETKPWLNGTSIQVREGRVTAYGADGVAITIWKGDAGVAGDHTLCELIPHKTGQLLEQYLPASDARISVGISRNHLIFELPGLTLASRTVEGQYPDLERMVPGNYPNKIRVQRVPLIKALERAIPFGTDEAARWDIQVNGMIVAARSPDAGGIEEPLPCEYTGDTPMTIGFNAKFVLAGLKVFTGDVVDVELINHKSPFRFRSPDDPEFTYIVMPLIVF